MDWKTFVGTVALFLAIVYGGVEVLHVQRTATCREVGKIMSMETMYSRTTKQCYIQTPQGWRDVRMLYRMEPFR